MGAYGTANRLVGALVRYRATQVSLDRPPSRRRSTAWKRYPHSRALCYSHSTGEAILFTHPIEALIRDTNFGFNHAIFGGALSAISTSESSVRLELCQFIMTDNASRGGALYFRSEGQSNIRGWRFYRNVNDENFSRGNPGSGVFFIFFLYRWISALWILANIWHKVRCRVALSR